MSKSVGGRVNVIPGPFTYKVKAVPGEGNAEKFGPRIYIMQVDKDGMEFYFAELSPLGLPGDAEFMARALNQASKRNPRLFSNR